jgi:hypothetical protein
MKILILRLVKKQIQNIKLLVLQVFVQKSPEI